MPENTQTASTGIQQRVARAFKRFRDDRDGASFIEYIIVVGLVAIIAIAAFGTFGQTVVQKLHEETNGLQALQPAPP